MVKLTRGTLQLGIILNGTSVIDTIPGGPGFNSRQIVPGDIILKIDGTSITSSNINTALVGNDVAGTPVVLTVAKGGPEVLAYASFGNGREPNKCFCNSGTSCQCADHTDGFKGDTGSSAYVRTSRTSPGINTFL